MNKRRFFISRLLKKSVE